MAIWIKENKDMEDQDHVGEVQVKEEIKGDKSKKGSEDGGVRR